MREFGVEIALDARGEKGEGFDEAFDVGIARGSAGKIEAGRYLAVGARNSAPMPRSQASSSK